MSAILNYFPKPAQGPNVLVDLLHSLSQPLTSLQCSLELSLDRSLDRSNESALSPSVAGEIAGAQNQSAAFALQEIEKVIGLVRLMREYVDSDTTGSQIFSCAFFPILLSVIEALSSIAAIHGVRLSIAGTCSLSLPLPESQLRLALQYLLCTIIATQPGGSTVALCLLEDPSGVWLLVESECESPGSPEKADPKMAALDSSQSDVKLVIARRILEGTGASLSFRSSSTSIASNLAGFVLHLPQSSPSDSSQRMPAGRPFKE